MPGGSFHPCRPGKHSGACRFRREGSGILRQDNSEGKSQTPPKRRHRCRDSGHCCAMGPATPGRGYLIFSKGLVWGSAEYPLLTRPLQSAEVSRVPI